MRWMRVTKFDPRAAALADRHYSRGAPGTPQFLPAGRTLALLTEDESAVWGTSWQVGDGVLWATHDWPRAWNCSIFRNEGDHLSSELVAEAVAATVAVWGDPPAQGFVTFVDVGKVRRKRDPGRCFARAGWRRVGWTRSGKLVLQLAVEDFPLGDPRSAGRIRRRRCLSCRASAARTTSPRSATSSAAACGGSRDALPRPRRPRPVRGRRGVRPARAPRGERRPLPDVAAVLRPARLRDGPGTSEAGVCPDCGSPWERRVETETLERHELDPSDPRYRPSRYAERRVHGGQNGGMRYTTTASLGWEPTCACGPDPVPAVVLDCFSGSGTTLLAARRLGRHVIAVELNEHYCYMAARRLGIPDAVEQAAATSAEPTQLVIG